MQRIIILAILPLICIASLQAKPPVPKGPKEEPKAGRPAPLAYPQLLLDENAQKAISLSDEQKEKMVESIKKFCEEEDAKLNVRLQKAGALALPGAGGGAPVPPPAIVAADIDDEDMKHTLQNLSVEGREKLLKPILEKTLTSEQTGRLREIDLQLQGPAAFLERHMIRALKLTELQEDKLEDVQTEFNLKREAWNDELEDEDEPNEKEYQKLTDQYGKSLKKAIEILSPEQRKIWEQKIGKPIPVKDLLPALSRGLDFNP